VTLLTIAEASRLMAARELSPVELTQACLDRIERSNPDISAFITVTPERAMSDARASEARITAGRRRTPLDGIPIGHKDLFDTAGIPTTAHSKVLRHNVPATDAHVVTRLTQAGTVMLGKLAMYEFALNGSPFEAPWPPARNPWGLDRATSGSSSGTASAIAAGLILGGTGTDTGGSIRSPAAYCGTSGIKPTYGLCSRAGTIPLAYTLDHVGPMAWTVEDTAMLLQEMAGHDPADPASADVTIPDYRAALAQGVRGLRIGVVRHFFETDSQVSPETYAGIEASLSMLRREGAILQDVVLPPLRTFSAVNRVIMNCEAASIHEQLLRARPGDYSTRLRNRLILATTLKSSDYLRAQRLRRELCQKMATVMAGHDLLVTAMSAGEAPAMEETSEWDGLLGLNLAAPWNLTGLPAMSVRTAFGPNHLPLSLQIGGRAFEEGTVLRAAHALERAAPWAQRRPPEARQTR
jgi:aspartyl-tRNA(Asn)/glutamyl-tRNA(Gln) amidotransferase subunit A